MKKLLISLLFLCGVAFGQNTLNGAPYSGSGSSVPGSCSGQGTMFFKTSTTRGWYWCNGGSFTAFGTGSGSGTVTSIATTSPITGGTITGTGTIACSDCLIKTPTADQTITGAHKLVMSAVDSGLVIGGSGPGATTAPFVLFGSGSSFSNGGEMTPSNAYTTFSMWNSTHGGLYIEGVADGSDGSGNAVPAFSLNGVWTAAQTLPAGHAIMEMIGNSPNSATQAPANTQLFGVNSDFSSNILAVFDSGGGAGGIRPGFLGLNLDIATPTGVFDLRSGATSSYDTKPLLVVRQGTTGQTGDLLELQNSTGTNLAKVDSTGLGTFANVIDSGLTASQIVVSNGSKQLASGTQTGTGTVYAAQTAPTFLTSITSPSYLTTTNCAAVGSAANPSVAACSAAASGAFSCATNASAGTCTVNTTAVTANSRIFVTPSSAEGTNLSVTCNTAPTVVPAIYLASKSAGTSFTINAPTFTTNPACFVYWIVN